MSKAGKVNTQAARNTHTGEQDMSNTQSTHTAAWKVFGRGASKTFTAALPAGSAEPGQHVTLTSKAGNVTTGTLTEVHTQTDDGLECWTFSKASKTPEERAADRARTAEANSAYWQSDAGVAAMARREARNARKASKASKAEAAPAQATQATPAPAPAQDMSALAASLKAAGFTAAEVLAAMTAQAQAAPAPAPAQASKASTGKASTCEVCNRQRKSLETHTAGMQACSQCMTCDDVTARKRAARHTG